MKPSQSIAALLLPFCLGAQNPYAGNKTEIDVGRGLFRILCAPCHGIGAQGGRGPDLTTGTFAAGSSDDDLFRVISNGVPGTEMPGFAARFGSDNVWRMVGYLRSATQKQDPPPNGNAANGEKLFWGKGACGQCHRVGQKGSPMGPDLTRIGRKRSLKYLKESLLNPDADLTVGFYRVTAAPAGGAKITGVQRGYDNFSCQIMTADGNLHSFSREQVPCEREFKSIMPAYKGLSGTEIDHLLTYLMTLRGE